jgi:hypothetical protein
MTLARDRPELGLSRFAAQRQAAWNKAASDAPLRVAGHAKAAL